MMSPAIDRILAEERLPDSYRAVIDGHWRPLAGRLVEWRRAAAGPIVIGINGPQGSGKTTLSRVLAEALLPEMDVRATVLALDDFYLPLAQRRALAATVHPLFATRGVPGTHDAALGIATIDALRGGQGGIRLPRFDKAEDDRSAVWHTHAAPPDIVLFEGWCVGAMPQAEAALVNPVNALEAEEDVDGRWRRAVNDRLARDYADWFARIDRLILLMPPDWDAVRANRARQEDKLRAATGRGMDDAALAQFMMHYERLTRHMLAEMPGRADAVIRIDWDQRPIAG
jgi:D-glycerate 3-kinase